MQGARLNNVGRALAAALTVGIIGAAGHAYAAGPISSNYYQPGQYTETYGVGIAFTGAPYLTGTTDQLNEFSNPDPQAGNSDPLFPSATVYFGADFTSLIAASTAGTYNFSETSDDAGYLFIDGSLVASTPGNHLPSTASGSIFLGAGDHKFEFQMANGGGPCCAEAVVNLPDGVTYVSAGEPVSGAPEPNIWALMIGAVGLTGAAMRRRHAVEQAIV